jgi:hypothetical protein
MNKLSEGSLVMTLVQKMMVLAVLCAGSALPAKATPPDVINVRDEVFGISASHLFVLRSTEDNLGLYTADRSDTLLVAIDLATGDETLWPVYGFYRGPDPADPNGEKSGVVAGARQDSTDPFGVLAEYGAVPAIAAFSRISADTLPSVTLDAKTLTVSYRGTEMRYALDSQALLAGMTASVNKVAGTIEDYDRFAPISTRDLLSDRTFAIQDCAVSDPMHLSALIETAPVQLVRVTCSDPDEADTTSLVVVVPPVAN